MTDATDTAVAERVSRTLMYAGAGLGVLSVAAWILGGFPAMPEWMVRLAIYKLTFVSGAGLVIAGAVVRRSSKPARDRQQELGEGAAPDFAGRDRADVRASAGKDNE